MINEEEICNVFTMYKTTHAFSGTKSPALYTGIR